MTETKSAIVDVIQGAALSHSGGLQTIQALVVLMIAATIVGVVASRIRLPYTVSLILVGIGLHALGVLPHIKLTHDLLMTVFLPALLFEAAIHFPASELKQVAPAISILAAPGVLLTALATALVLQLEFSTFGLSHPVGFMHFLLFGTIIAATDPISVISLLRQLGVDRKLSVLIEGESLFNDGTAIVLYSVVLGMLSSGHLDVSSAILQLIVMSVGGIVIGAILGLFASLLISFMEDHLFSIAITTVTAYGTYLLAEGIGVSGILATVVAGLFVGNIGKKKGMSPTTRMAVVSFWEYVAFFISSLVFLMMGLEVSVPLLFYNKELILFAFLAVLLSRAISVFLPIPLLRRVGQPIDFKKGTVLWWAGLRGSLSMVLVLSLPESLEVRHILIAMTFGVVVLSVVVQGTTMGPLLRLLGMVPKRTDAAIFLSKGLARLRAIRAQQHTVSHLLSQDLPIAHDLSNKLKVERAQILTSLDERSSEPEFAEALAERLTAIEQDLQAVARDSYRESLQDNLLTDKEVLELNGELYQ